MNNKIREMVLELLCTGYPLPMGVILSKVITHPKWKGHINFFTLKLEVQRLIDEGKVYMTEQNWTKKYYA